MKRSLSLRKQQALWGYIFTSPWTVGTALLIAWPLLRSLLLSLQDVTDILNLQTEWVGLKHYVAAFREDIFFVPALLRTLRDLVINVPLVLVFSLSMALLIAGVRRGQTFLRGVFFLPIVIGSSGVVSYLLSADMTSSLMGDTLQMISQVSVSSSSVPGGEAMSPASFVVSRLSVLIWRTGVQILLFVAGLNTVAPSLYEASRVDGANGWEMFWKITLPMLSPVILVAAIYSLVDTFMANDAVTYIMDVGVGTTATHTLMGRVVDLGFSAALGWMYFLVVFVVVALIVRLSSRMVFYAGERQ